MATLSRGVRLAISKEVFTSRTSVLLRAPLPASTSSLRQPCIRMASTLCFPSQLQTPCALPRTSPTLSALHCKSSSSPLTLVTRKAYATSANATSTSTSTASARTIAASEYIEEGPELLDAHQPRIIVGDPARGRWTMSGVHAYVMAFILHLILWSFLIIDFINDLYTYLGAMVSEQLGR
ncbi:hypothetical protein BD324DRAFT_680321 [Kockovaella imperatae]|uniref:Uncharacterized protein n=1 Tax=Kockovaella imperatae TaxID=4999 RepID=A0A1Y1UKN4_9TREE|nr:hypothetical protein BD324DRAFT_680321 [Kockovaella imperatae]ORX38611.1 hypothetical protein BD324DRAFT_680321 [Kockovaella imperatae]